jgi:OOP family OmpA-OmpF porin
MQQRFSNRETRRTVARIAIGAMLLGPSATSVAEWYAAVAAGQSKATEVDSVCSDLLRLLPAGTSCDSDDTDSGWKFAVGNQISQTLAAEVAYVDLGKGKFSVAGPGVGGSGEFQATGFNVGVVGTLPLHRSFSLNGRVGLFLWDADLSVSGVGGASSDSESGADLSYGVAAQYHFNPVFSVTVEWERFQEVGEESSTGKSDIDLLSAGLVVRF